MDNSNHILKTAESCKVIDNAGKMSFETTQVSPNNNNNKENSEIFDDPMVCDDDSCIDNDVDVGNVENIQSITGEVHKAVTEEIPPKFDISCTFASPKSKKRKLPGSDKLLETLQLNFTKLLHFLESDNKEMTFPFVLKEYEDFFEMIVQDINILKSKILDTDYRDICDKIMVAATGYLLTCVYEYRQDFQKIVMVIKKEHSNMMDQSENRTSSFSFSTESVMPSSQTSSEVNINEILSRTPSPDPISNGFKLRCLRTALAFIKNDITETEEFPELNLEQAHFMQLLLESVIAFTEFDSNLEIKDLYRALWEAIRIYRLKYEFRIKCEESSGGKKNLFFEKVPKNKPPVRAVHSNQTMNPKTDNLRKEVSKPEASKTEAPKPEASKPEASKREALKPETPKPDAPKPGSPKPEPVQFPMPVIPKLPNVNENPTRVTKRMLNSKLKMENENLFIKRLPSKFISDALITIRDFLLDEGRHKLVLVPKTHTELDFYRNCLTWCRTTLVVDQFGNEFQEMHHQISCILFHVNCTVTKGSSNKINEITGIKEVSYIKELKHVPILSVLEPAQSAPKKKKINIQNAIQLAETDNIKLETVINLNQSLRNKKKNKKRQKRILKAASMEAAVKPLNQAKAWTDGSSSNCSSRGTSTDRSKKVTKAQKVSKRPLNEMNQSSKYTFQETPRRWRGEEMTRKEQLKEALSVPVQSDKAMRMMRGMGWSGGALGARGNGITEPLMPLLDIARGAGLGHSKKGQSETIAKKPGESKTAPAFVSEKSSASSETDKMETDVIVQKTKQLLLENPTFDTIMKTMQSNVELTKSTKTTIDLEKQGNSNLDYHPNFRQEVLHSILELLISGATSKILTYKNKICKKHRKFVANVKMIKSRNDYGIFQKEEHGIYRAIQDKYKKLPEVIFETSYSHDFRTLQITKRLLTGIELPTQQLQLPSFTQTSLKASTPNTETISEENIYSYIKSSGTNYESERAYEILKFKVLFLLNILSFVKSFNEEVEVTFNKVLNLKQQTYIQNVLDEVNMRIKFGSTPAETKLCAEIRNHVKDAFLAFMFNHQYTVVTLSKHFRFKRLNRPDNAVKRTSQTTVNLDAFSSETFSKPKLNTNEPTVKENNNKDVENNSKVAEINNKAENNNNVYENNSTYVAFENNAVALAEEPKVNKFEHYDDSNSSSDEEKNNDCTVSKLPLGEEDISNLLCLYDEEKTDTASVENNININNDSTSKNVTDNRNKNNIGNGNVVIDNNDNQVIDMKRDCGNTKNIEENNIIDTEMAEYVVCVDYAEEAVDSAEITVDKEKEENITGIKKDGEEIYQTKKHSDIVVTDDVIEMVNQHKEIGIDNVDKINDDGLSKTEDTIDQNVLVIGDSDSNDCTETIVKDEIQNGDNPPTSQKDINDDTDVIMKEIDDEPMQGISITEKSKEVIGKEDSVKEINIEESMGLMNQGEPIEEINQVKSSKDLEVAKMEEENSINPNDDQIVKGDLEIKTDGDIISTEKLVLSEKLCDTHSLGLSHVKTMCVTKIHDIHISKDTEIKTVRIVHTIHPFEELTNENIKEIQRHISNCIFLATQLPLLKCHGVQNGALIYSCHNKHTYDWLQNTVSFASYVKVLNTKEITKMALKFYCFFDCYAKDLFRMIEWYNQELSTKDWVVEKTEKDGDSVIFIVRMDKFSIKFIQESNLALFAGIDKIQFSPVSE